MKHYTVAPNKDAMTWLIKIEDVASLEEYDKLDKAIEAGERIAQGNKPSTLTILAKDHNVQEKRTFED